MLLKCCAQFSSVTQLSLTLCDPMDCSTPGLPVHHQLLELAQTHVHWISDAIQPSHSLSFPSLPAFNLSQHQGLFKWVKSVLCIRWLKYWSFSFSISPSSKHSGLIFFRIDWFDLHESSPWAISLRVQGTSQESSPAPQLEGTNFSALSLPYGPTLISLHD